MNIIHKLTEYSYSAVLQTFEANIVFAMEMLEVFILPFVSNVCKYCTQDLNKLYVYEKRSCSHMRCTLFYENWKFMKSAQIHTCDALCFMKIWI